MKILNKFKLKFSLKTRAINKLNVKYKDKDSWAVISGCTSGIGKSYAEILGENNFNLILISRNEDKLNKLKDSIIRTNKDIKTVIYKMDFSDYSLYSKENYDKYLELFSQMKIRLLINNVGESSYGGDFFKYDIKKNKSIVNVNINSNLFLTQLFINSQLKFNQDNKEADEDRRGIINISSYFGSRHTPGQSVYSSSKKFISNFSSCLFYELKKHKNLKVDILNMSPLMVMTNMVRKWKYSRLLIQPEEIVYSSFLRINSITIHSYGHWKHIILSLLLKLVPDFLFCSYTDKFYTSQYDKIFSRRKQLKIK